MHIDYFEIFHTYQAFPLLPDDVPQFSLVHHFTTQLSIGQIFRTTPSNWSTIWQPAFLLVVCLPGDALHGEDLDLIEPGVDSLDPVALATLSAPGSVI